MKRRGFIAMLGGAAAGWPLMARAQQPSGKVPRVGWLGIGSASASDHGIQAFERGFRDLGYVPGTSVVIEHRFAEGRYDRVDALAAELVRLPVDVIFAATSIAAVAARNATATIPIVFANVSWPDELGLVASLARPGGNITGLTYHVSPEIVGKQLQLLQEVRPRVSRAAVLWNPGNPRALRVLAEAKNAAGALGMQLRIIEARAPDDLEGAFRTMAGEGTDVLLVLPDPMLYEQRAALGSLALKRGLPTMVGSREDLGPGCLMAYGASRLDLIRRAAGYVDRILKGARPADLPVEQPTRFELIVNLATAKALGLTIPDSILARADEVIE